jgi:hypothetical protein
MSRDDRVRTPIDTALLLARSGTLPSCVADAPASRRKFLSGLLASAGTLALAACGGGGGSGGASGAGASTNPNTSTSSNPSSTSTNTSSANSTGTTTASDSTTGSSGTANTSGTSGTSGASSTESTSGTTIPTASAIIDRNGVPWTLSSGAVLKATVDTDFPATSTLLLYWNHTVYAEDGTGNWYVSGNNGWSVSSDPRSSTSSPPATSFFYGMNGHMAYTSGVYATVTPAEQLALLQDLGVTNYRADVYDQNDAQLLANILTGAFANSGVSILPCMLPVYLNQSGTETDAYNLGFQLAVSVTTPLKGLVKYIECGNELDAGGLVSTPPGDSFADFNPAYWPAYRGVIRGMIDGVKSVDPTIQCGIDVGVPLAYPALQMLWNGITPDGSSNGVSGATPVRWDVTMYHWYESSGDIQGAGANGNINVLDILAQSFGLPIWLTEWGFVPSDSAAGQASYVTGRLNEYYSVRSQYNLQSIMMYELISAASSDDFGLIETDGTTKRLAYTAFKNFTAAHPV